MSNENLKVFKTTSEFPKTRQQIEDQISADFEKLAIDRCESPEDKQKAIEYLKDTTSDRGKSTSAASAARRLRALRIFQGTNNHSSRLTQDGAVSLSNYRRLLKTFSAGKQGFDILKEHIIPCRDHLVAYEKYGEVEKKEFGEVMTPMWLVDEMLDTLPPETWTNPSIKILDPANGCGIFPIEVVRRLFYGLAEDIPDPEERYWHILTNNIFACDIQAKNNFLYKTTFDPNDSVDMNIHYGSFLDESFDHVMKNIWGVRKFDIVIGNPPYQEMTDGHGAQARALYNKFSEKAFVISSSTLFVTPSRWFAGGMGLGDFREKMLNSKKIKLIKHFPEDFRQNGEKIFGNDVEIKGGVSYFLQDNDYSGPCEYNGNMVDLSKYDVLIQDSRLAGIVDKVKNLPSLAEFAKSRSYFGISTNDKNVVKKNNSSNFIDCYMSKQKGFLCSIDPLKIKKNFSYDKVYIAADCHGGWSGLGNIFIGNKKSVASFSYMHFSVDSAAEAKSLASFLNTKTANVLVSLRKASQHLKANTFNWVPLLPLDRTWDDASVYDYLDLTEEEISLIEEVAANIKGAHK